MHSSANSELRLSSLERLLRFLVVLACIAFIGADLFIIFARIFYPYQLEWMEGASLVQVDRLVQGGQLYVKPSVAFVPLIYPPLYFYVSAVIARIFGIGFGALRIVSLCSSIGCGVVLFFAVREYSHSRFAGFLAVGVFSSTFMLTGQWFDIARVDMLTTGLSMLGIYLANYGEPQKAASTAVVAGFIFALASLTKQSSLAVGIAAGMYFLIFNWRRGLLLTGSFLVSTVLLYWLFSINSSGWMNYYLLSIPAAHYFDFQFGRIVSVLIGQISPILFFFLVALMPVLLSPRKVLWDATYRYYLVMAGALLATAVVGRLNAFSGRNVYVPAYVGISLLVGLQASWLPEMIHRPKIAKFGRGILIFEWSLIVLQFGTQLPAYFQTTTIPTEKDLQAGAALVSMIKSYRGDVILLDNNYLALYAGKTPYFNEMPMSEISGQGNLHPMPEWTALQPQISPLFHSPSTDAIIVDFAQPIKDFVRDCHSKAITYADKATFIPVAGPNSRPTLMITCR